MNSSTSSLRTPLARLWATAALGLACVTPASAIQVSRGGSFIEDDQVRFFTLTLSAPGSITVASIGYGGGTDAQGNAVAAGGFDTMLFLYTSAGVLVAQSDDGISAAVDPATGLAADAAFTTGAMAAGVYRLALTQYDNFALGDLSAGFSQSGAGNFTPSLSGSCAALSFCDWGGNARTSAWNLNFNGQTLAAIPEPATALLVLAAAGVVLTLRRSGRRVPLAYRLELAS